MHEKCQTFLNALDLIGTNPHLLIFKKKRYKYMLSSLISLVIILFSIIFSIISICEYLKYESPIVVYTKANDHETKREAFMKDTLLMFQVL